VVDTASTFFDVSLVTGPGGQMETSQSPAWPARIPALALRISHFPGSPTRSLRRSRGCRIGMSEKIVITSVVRERHRDPPTFAESAATGDMPLGLPLSDSTWETRCTAM
jgi:hypothetical protein